MQLSDQNESDDFDAESISPQLIKLEDSQTSWSSYLFSPVKVTMQKANEFITIATRNPKLAMVVGMYYMIPAVTALGGWYMQATCHKTPYGNNTIIPCDGYNVNAWLGWTSEPIIHAGPTHGFSTQEECQGGGNICDLGPRSGYIEYQTPWPDMHKYKEFGCEWVMPYVYIWQRGNSTYYNCVQGIFR
jgi:hypothetical protein